jgi:hypothetical protein
METGDITRTPRNRWWREVLYIAAFYLVYSSIRNLFGSAQVSPDTALRNAYRIIDLQQLLLIYHEPTIQGWFLDWTWFIKFWNVFYATLHFLVTGGVLIWLFLRADELRYRRWRNTLAIMTGLALIGFALFPLMPPRLLPDCGPFGGCVTAPFVDTMARYGGLWSFRDGPMEAISNQYAAMPSLHVGWALWCVAPFLSRGQAWRRTTLLLLYPLATVFAIVVTGNHFVLDAAGGLLVLVVAHQLAFHFTRPAGAPHPLARGPLARSASRAPQPPTPPPTTPPDTGDSRPVGYG